MEPTRRKLVAWDDIPAGTRIVGRFDTKWSGATKDTLSRAERDAAARDDSLPPEQERT